MLSQYFILFILIQVELYKAIEVSDITKFCFPDLSVTPWSFKFKWYHFTSKVFWVSNGLDLFVLMFFAL